MSKAKNTTSPAFTGIENYFERNSRLFFIITLIIGVVLVLLNFEAKISTANDDALYIQGASRYVNQFPDYYYTENAPLYVMFLALVVMVAGLNIVLMKLFSVLFFVLSIYFFYRAFKGRIPNVVLFPALLVAATNPMILNYASLTFTEAFYMMLQALFFLLFFRAMDKVDENDKDLKGHWKQWVLIGFMLFIMFLTRNVAIGVIVAVAMYFATYKRFRAILYTAILFVAFVLLFNLVKDAIWGSAGQFSNQGKAMFQKDYYDASKGQEDFSGFIDRFLTNTSIYYGNRFWEVLELREETYDQSFIFTVLIIGLLIFGYIRALKSKNRPLVLVSYYIAVLSGITFIALHTNWAQARLIMIFVPYILAIVLYGFYDYIRNKEMRALQPVYLGVAGIVVAIGFFTSLSRGADNVPTLRKNLKGDIYSGYTNDWQNFVKMSKWTAENLPDTTKVASRKQPISFVYGGGKEFFAIYNVPSEDPEVLLARFRDNGVTHVIVASLRLNPNVADGNVISTVHRYLYLIAQKYPDAFKLVHEEGVTEKAQLYEIDYAAIDRRKQMQ